MANHAPPAVTIYNNGTTMAGLTKICIDVPPKINSQGIWGGAKDPITKYSMPVFQLQMFIFFAITESLHFILKHFGLPKFVSQIIGGALLSPDFLGRYKSFIDLVLPPGSIMMFETAGNFGYMLYLFITGVKIDVGMIRTVGRKAFAIGVLSLAAPMILGVGIVILLSIFMGMDGSEISELMMLTAVDLQTSFPSAATFLHDLKIINSELGRLCISSAFISDVVNLTHRFIFITFMKEGVTIIEATLDCVLTLTFVAVVAFIIRPALLWVIRQTPEGRPVKSMYIYIIIITIFASGLITDKMGQFLLLGPFIIGLAVPDGPPLGSALVGMFEGFVSAVLLPLFASSALLEVSISGFGTRRDKHHLKLARGIVLAVTFMIKVAAGMAAPLYCSMPIIDALLVGLIMCSKGIPDLGGYLVLRQAAAISADMYVTSVVYLLVSTVFVSVAVNCLYDPARKYAGYQKRNIMNSIKKNSELHMLACIYRSGNIPATINLLNAIHPTKEEPINVCVLHLVELAGRASPILISHQMQKKKASSRSYSENVIMSFGYCTRKNPTCMTTNIFTAISPPKLMHEDICTLALRKQVSVILLPFHKKWSLNGSVESDDYSTRILNKKVLERAPCSVGILVDHGYLGRRLQSSYQVCMVFVGGKDDREALTLSKRMARGSNVFLTVIRLIAKSDEGNVEWDIIIDSEELKDIKEKCLLEHNVRYLEEVVEDGSQTALKLTAVLNEYDLIIVGRRYGASSPQTSGLAEWPEYPELGSLGDLLTSSDINSKTSILVVQQQQLT